MPRGDGPTDRPADGPTGGGAHPLPAGAAGSPGRRPLQPLPRGGGGSAAASPPPGLRREQPHLCGPAPSLFACALGFSLQNSAFEVKEEWRARAAPAPSPAGGPCGPAGGGGSRLDICDIDSNRL